MSQKHWLQAGRSRSAFGIMLVVTCSFALAITAFVNLTYIASTAPALNPSVRDSEFFDDWRLGAGGMVLNGAEYNRARAFDYLRQIKGPADMPLARRAAQLSALAVNAAPADAYGWSLLAWSTMLRMEPQIALTALNRSWVLGPDAPLLSADRVLVATGLGLLEPSAATPWQLERLQEDVSNFVIGMPQLAANAASQYPALEAFIQQMPEDL